jgi:hypothetical protein
MVLLRLSARRDKDDQMNNKDVLMNSNGGSRPIGVRPWRTTGVVGALAVTALLAAACGGSSPATNTFAPGATYAQVLAFAKCMRLHGVSQFPDPDREGNFNNATIQALESNNSQDRNALFPCRSVLPNAGTGLTVEQIQQIQQQNVADAVKAAHCMRAHGITNFPDPAATTGASGVNWQPVVSAMQAGKFSTSTPSYEAALKACNNKREDGGIIPPGLGQSPVVPGSGPPSGSPPPGAGNGS